MTLHRETCSERHVYPCITYTETHVAALHYDYMCLCVHVSAVAKLHDTTIACVVCAHVVCVCVACICRVCV